MRGIHHEIKESFQIQHTLQSVIDFMKSMGLELSEKEVEQEVISLYGHLLLWNKVEAFVVKKTLTKPLRAVSATSLIIMSFPF